MKSKIQKNKAMIINFIKNFFGLSEKSENIVKTDAVKSVGRRLNLTRTVFGQTRVKQEFFPKSVQLRLNMTDEELFKHNKQLFLDNSSRFGKVFIEKFKAKSSSFVFHSWKKLKKLMLVTLEVVVITAWLFSPFAPQSLVGPEPVKTAKAATTYQFTPTGGRIVTGNATSTNALLAAAVEGVNMGSWKGTLADDNMHWVVEATTTAPVGFDVQLDISGVNLNGSNKFMIETGFDLDSTNTTNQQVPHTLVQICDWTSSTGVDAPADANCTTGGWRTVNPRKIPIIATSTETSVHYEIYNGYFSDGQGDAYSTPLANFINTSNNNTVNVRYVSHTNTNQSIAIDFLRLYAFVSPVYMPSSYAPMTNGDVVTPPSGLPTIAAATTNVPYDSELDSQYTYTVGSNSTPDWYIEKRLKSGGLNGSVTGAAASREARAVALNQNYMYVVGDDQGASWRIEKRSLASGATYAAFGTLDLSFGTAGVISSASGTPMKIAIDNSYMYVAGGSAGDWRIEKRLLSTGALNGSFGSSGVVTGVAATATSTGIFADTSYLYVVGTDSTGWRIEKRLKTTGALCTGGACGADFDTDGIITGGTGTPMHVYGDSLGNIYITGYTTGNDWQIEKRSASTGALDGTFGSGTGVVTSSGGSQAYNSHINTNYLYTAGDDGTDWRVEKRELSSGNLVNGFGSSGVVTGTGITVTAFNGEVDQNYIYVIGTQTGTDWRFEKRNLSDGAISNGYGYMLGDTVNINAPTAGSSDNAYLAATSSAASAIPDFYMKFKNVKTYTGMNSVMFRTEVSCSATAADNTYKFSIYNNASSGWETLSENYSCSATDATTIFSKHAPSNTLSTYINNSSEIWLRMSMATSSVNSNLRIDQIYMMLGSVNENSSAAQVTFGTETAGRITSNPTTPGNDRILDMESDSTYLYLAGYNGIGGDDRWRVEKRLKTTGALDTSFGIGGATTTDPTVNSDQIQAITIDSTYMYLAGYEGTGATNFDWRVEKRQLSDGALVTAFDTDGILTTAPSTTNDIIYDIKVTADSIFLIGQMGTTNSQWRIEKRDIITGSLCDNSPGTECGSAGAFDTDGIYLSNPSVNADIPFDSTIMGSNVFIVGQDATVSTTDIRWRIEARDAATGAAMAGFGASGATTTNFSANSDIPYDIENDGTNLYVGGWDGVVSATDLSMRIMKVNGTNGNVISAFGTAGSKTFNPANDFDQITRLRYYSGNLYFSAYQDDDAGIWWVGAANATTGATSTSFNGTNGVALSEDGGDDRPTSLEVDASGVYAAGWGTGPGNNQWMIEKRDEVTGLLDTTFGGAGVAGTRQIDFNDQVNRSSWNIQAEEERATMSQDFYAFDNDATSDATVEEAKAATFDVPVTLPSGASVVSNFYAINYMAGASGTVRLAFRDYSGFTGSASGGRIIVSPAGPTTSMQYDDPIEGGLLLANGGYNGIINNPEDNVDTKNNRMTMSIITTVAAATTTKATMMIDYAMATIGWVEDTDHQTSTYQYTPTGGRIVIGNATSTNALLAAAAEGVNMGSWKGTLADDNMHWVVEATTTAPVGFDVQLDMSGVNLNGANKFMIETGYDLDSTNTTNQQVPHTLLQICDWVSSTGVDVPADANCTTGGWRTVNPRKIPIIATSTETSVHYEIYNGYFSDGQGGSYSTPLANFIDTDNNDTVTFRYVSHTNTNQSIAIDFLRLYAFVSPMYMPSSYTPIVNGVATSSPEGVGVLSPPISSSLTQSVADNQYIYAIGNNTTPDWYIEKHNKNGTFEAAVTGAGQTLTAQSIAINQNYMYVVGIDSGTSWRIEKRSLASGAGVATFGTLDQSFGTLGVISSASGTPRFIKIDSSYMYVVGDSGGNWRIEKRLLSTGALDNNFGSSGVVTGSGGIPTSFDMDSTYMYIAGFSAGSDWQIEKRLRSTGAVDNSFGTSGVVTGDAASAVAYSIAIDSTYMYIAGTDASNNWRIEKRLLSTGDVDNGFGSAGVVTPDTSTNAISVITIDSTYMYLGGNNDSIDFRVEKRLLSTGGLDNGFGNAGVINRDSTSQLIYGLTKDSNYLYAVGTNSTTDWLFEKYNLSDGAITPGYGYMLGDIVNINAPTAGSSDNIYLVATSTASSTIPDFYMKFKDIKTYTGMNSILFRPEVSCSATVLNNTYSFSVYNNASSGWESLSDQFNCTTGDTTTTFSKYAPAGTISNYINGSNEVWLRMNFATSTLTSALRIDQLYIMLGSVNEDSNAAQVTFGTETAGRVTSNPANPGNDRILDMESDSTYLYTVGFGNVGGDDRWRIEKRLKTTGALDTGFGTNGVVISDPTVNSDQAQAITQDGTYMYVAGYEGTGVSNFDWRVEKRNLSDGALVSAFGTAGVVTTAPTTTHDVIYDIKVDANAIYLIGQMGTANAQWRIEKRDIITGSLCDNSPGTECGSAGAFDTDGIYLSNPSANNDIPYDAVIVGSNIYIVGQDSTVSAADIAWRIEARNTATGAAMAGFGTSGATTTNFSANSDIPYDIESDGTNLYVGGWDGVVSGTDLSMRIMKVNATNGAVVSAFGTAGSKTFNPANDFDQITRLRYYSSNLYFAAYQDDDAGIWWVGSMNSTTGATSTSFNGTNGVAFSEDGGDDRPTSLEVDASGVYAAGWGTGPGNNQWMIEKRDPTTGLLDSTFGGAGVAGTRTIDLNDSVNRQSWNIQAEEERATMSHDFYAFDNDGTSDATVEEAKAATLDFPVTLPSGVSVVSNYYAANFMAGASGTVRFGFRDYSGFTGATTGGRILTGPVAGATSAMTYDDPFESALLLANGGYNGVINNPEDNVDTKNNRMTMSFVTTVAAATTTKATMMIDFAMVSIGWIDSTPPSPSGITVSGTFYMSDEVTAFATSTTVSLAVSDSTVYHASTTNGVFSFTAVTQPSNGNILTLWVNNGSTHGTLVFDYGAGCSDGNCSGLKIFKDKVIIDSKNSSVLTNSSLANCDNDTGSACSDSDIGFTSNGGNLSLTWTTNTLRLPNATSKFAPGGQISAQTFQQSNGEFNGGSSDLTFTGDFILAGGIATSTSALLRVRGNWDNDATYKHNNGMVEIDPLGFDGFSVVSGMTATGTKSFYDLRVLKPGAIVRFTSGENVYVDHNFRFEGAPGNPSRMRATVLDSQWFLYVGNNALVNWSSVRDSGCVAGTVEIFNTPTSLNFGNNGPCWHFVSFGGNGGGFSGPQDDPNAGGGGGNGQGGGGGGGGGEQCVPPRAIAVLTADSVTSVIVQFGGSCFATAPTVTFSGGGGSGAEAHAEVSNGRVTSITVDSGGSGYVSPPTISFTGESGGSGGGEQQGGGGSGGGGGGAAP